MENLKTHNYCIVEKQENCEKKTIGKIASFFANELNYMVYIISKQKYPKEDLRSYFLIDSDKKRNIVLVNCFSDEVLLNKLLEFDKLPVETIPRVLIVQSLVSIIL